MIYNLPLASYLVEREQSRVRHFSSPIGSPGRAVHRPINDRPPGKKVATLNARRASAIASTLILATCVINTTSNLKRMTSRKRNDPFDLAASDDDDQDKGYDSAADEEAQSKGALRSAKRRRVNDTDNLHGLDSDDSDLDAASDSEEERSKGKGRAKAKKPTTRAATAASGDEDEDDEEEDAAAEDATATASPSNKKKSPLLKKDKKNKTGVVYLSSLPPHLKPYVPNNVPLILRLWKTHLRQR